MPPHNIPFQFYQSPLSQMPVTAAGNIAFDRMGCVIPADTTDGAMTLVLAAPTKAGIIGTVVLAVDNGDLTLTVDSAASGYNADGDTSITFDDAQDFVTFISIYVGSTYYWRVLGQEGTNVAGEAFTVDTLAVDTLATIASANIATANIPIQTSTTLAAEHGAGMTGGTAAPITTRRTVNGTIITEIKVELQGLQSSGSANDIIGKGTTPAFIGKNVVATNGVIFKIEMACIEVPATADTDINLVSGSAGTDDFDEAVTGAAVEINGGAQAAGMVTVNLVPAVAADYWFYLTCGTGGAETYSAGQLIITLYGHPVLT